MATGKSNDSLCYIIRHNILVVVPQVKNIVHVIPPESIMYCTYGGCSMNICWLNEYSIGQCIEIIYICVVSLLWDPRDFAGILLWFVLFLFWA